MQYRSVQQKEKVIFIIIVTVTQQTKRNGILIIRNHCPRD